MPRTRVAARLSAALLLDFVALNREGRGLLDGLILAAIIQGNLAPLVRDPGLQATYAAPTEPAPDSLRRPVIVHAVAESLRVPYETVRRRVKVMTADGLIVLTPNGVYVPQAFFATPQRLQAAGAFYGHLREHYYRITDLGAVGDLPSAPEIAGAPPVRVCMRAYAEYFLRMVDLLTRRFGDLIVGVILLNILRANTAHLTDADHGGEGLAPADFPADHLRRPVSVLDLANQSGVPRETVRRYVNELLSAGRCARRPTGVIVPAAELAGPEWSGMMLENLSQLNRMLVALAGLGVTARWDAERAMARAAGATAQSMSA